MTVTFDPKTSSTPPEPTVRQPWDRRRVTLVVTLGVLTAAAVLSFPTARVSPGALVSGLSDVRNLLVRMFPPHFDRFDTTLRLAFETFWIALAGTALAVVCAFPLAFLRARNTAPHPALRSLANGVIVTCRAVPDLIFALIFVRALSIGVLPGVLAIGIHSIGMIGKLFTDAIERIDEGALEAVAATGSGRLQQLSSGVVPQVVPSFVATAIYRLDINIRGSVILGYVGAGGIGQVLKSNFGKLDYRNALGIVIVIMVIVIACELASSAVRRAVLGRDAMVNVAASLPVHRGVSAPRFDPDAVRPQLTLERVRLRAFAVVTAALVAVAFWRIEVSPSKIWHAVPKIWQTFLKFLPPDFTTARSEMITGIRETIAIALVATALGALAAVPVGLFAARNVAPSRAVYFVVRYLLVIFRSVPELLYAIVFVSAVGLGPFAGALSLSIFTFGFVAKLVADATEEIRSGPREAVLATGASRSQETASAVIAQAMPAIVSALLYSIDINIRAATVLGIVGAGGIGFLLNNSIRGLNYQTTGALLIAVFAMVWAIEQLSAWVRKQLG
ncbi:MAG: phosphonate ABC transporter, permease protein PhnE [Acidimicrobiia bacterium]